MEEQSATPAELQEIIAQEKSSEENNITRTIQVRVAPTPHPEELKALKKINPKYPDMVLGMATKEQRFRHLSTYFGQINFLAIPGMGYSAAVVLGFAGLEFAATASILATTYLAYVFKTKNPKPPKIDMNNGNPSVGMSADDTKP